MNTHDILRDLVGNLRCKPGWSFAIRVAEDALRLVITVNGYDSAHPNNRVPLTVSHWFPVPEATYNRASWARWVFECCRGVENHELGEWFRIGADRPFQPLHGPGEIPYLVREFRPMADALTTQDGSMREPYTDR